MWHINDAKNRFSELVEEAIAKGPEIRKGMSSLVPKDPEMAGRLAGWLDGLEDSFGDRILNVDAAIAGLWGEWSGQQPRPIIETLLAATAIYHDLVW